MALQSPTIISLSPDSGPTSNLTTTSDQLLLKGTSVPGTIVTIFDGTAALGTAIADLDGVWTYTASDLADGAHSFAAIAIDSTGIQSAVSTAISITVEPDIQSFSPLTDQWSKPISIDNLPFFVENTNLNGNAPWAISQTDSHTLRFELRPSDMWQSGGSHRTEVAGGMLVKPTQTVDVSYQFKVEPGEPNKYWTVLGQFHTDESKPQPNPSYPTFAVELTGPNGIGQGDYLAIWADYTLPGDSTPTPIVQTGGLSAGWLYVSPTPIVRGQYYSVQVEANFENNANGFLEVSLNGDQIVDYHGPLGYGQAVYWKEGIYQDESNKTQTIAADYSNLVISTTPAAPSILSNLVNGSHVILSGEAQANSMVTIFDGATKLGTATVDSSGSWTYQTGQLSLGSHTLTATATDSSGSASGQSLPSSATVTSLATPIVTGIDASQTSGELNVGNSVTFSLHTSTAVTVAGTPTLTLNDGGTATYVGGSGTSTLTFKYTVAAINSTVSSLEIKGLNLPAGTTIADAGGNAMSPVGAIAKFPGLEVNMTPVQTPTFTTSTTNADGTHTLNGTAGPNTQVAIIDNLYVMGLTAVDSSGHWTFTTPTLTNNTWHDFYAVNINELGDRSAVANGPGFPGAANLPGSPVVTGNALVDDAVTLYGTAGANITVKVYDGGTFLGSTTANSNGNWSFTSGALPKGVHTLAVTATNASGTSAPSVPFDMTIGGTTTTTPTPPALAAPAILSFSNDSGSVGDHITNDNTLTLTGTADANATIKVYDGTKLLGTATANGSGAWSFTTAVLANGTHNLTAIATDATGNTSATSSALNVTVDTVAPAVPQIATDTVNSDSSVTLAGTAEASATIKVYDGTKFLGTATANGSGAWSFTTAVLTNGAHSLTATAADTAGNTSAASAAMSVTVDPAAPGDPVISAFSSDSGVVGDHITNDNTPTLTGTADANAIIKVYDGAKLLGTTTANGSGAWSYTTAALANGTHNLTATATDATGSTGAASPVMSVTVDTVAPTAPVIATDAVNGNNTVVLTGKAEANSTVKVFDSAHLLGTTSADGSGAWSYTTAALANGTHSLTATATDVAGNTGAASSAMSVSIDTTALSKTMISSFSSDSGIAGDGITNDNTLTLTGTAEANSTVKVYDNAHLLGTTSANGSGAWSYTTAALANGTHSLTATATDVAGNTGAASSVMNVTIDAVAPTAPVITNDSVNRHHTVGLTGTAEADSTVKVYDNAHLLGTTSANDSGAWSYTTAALANGTHSLTATATDAAGNTGAASSATSVTMPHRGSFKTVVKNFFDNWHVKNLLHEYAVAATNHTINTQSVKTGLAAISNDIGTATNALDHTGIIGAASNTNSFSDVANLMANAAHFDGHLAPAANHFGSATLHDATLHLLTKHDFHS